MLIFNPILRTAILPGQMFLPGITPEDISKHVEKAKKYTDQLGNEYYVCDYCGNKVNLEEAIITKDVASYLETTEQFDPETISEFINNIIENTIKDIINNFQQYSWYISPAADAVHVTQLFGTIDKRQLYIIYYISPETRLTEEGDTLLYNEILKNPSPLREYLEKYISPLKAGSKGFTKETVSCQNCISCFICGKQLNQKEKAYNFKSDQPDKRYCDECEENYYCQECKNYNEDVESRHIGEEDMKICESCWQAMWDSGYIGSCEDCGNVFYRDDLHEFQENWLCSTCYENNPNVISYNTLTRYREPYVSDDINYFKEQYPNVFTLHKDASKKKKKAWNYIQNWMGGFEFIPPMDVEITRPSTDYEGTYIEFDLRTFREISDLCNESEREISRIFYDLNSGHPCLVSSNPERLIVARILAEDDTWYVKLMQGSVNQEARKIVQSLTERIKDRSFKCYYCKGKGNVHSYAIRETVQCDRCKGAGKMNLTDEQVEESKIDLSLYNNIVKYTNGAYLAAYDWISQFATRVGAECYVEIPELQAAQFGSVPQISLEMIYGAIPSLMEFKVQKEEEIGTKKYKIAISKEWNIEKIVDLIDDLYQEYIK